MTKMNMNAKLNIMETFGWYMVYEDNDGKFIRFCAPLEECLDYIADMEGTY